ncbi:MAG: PQQ-binding-like beta-propeller repeat protein, partial [Raoultibacter sp.]
MQSHIASRLFSTLLAFVLAASLVPGAAWAQDATPPTSPEATPLAHTAAVATDEAAPTAGTSAADQLLATPEPSEATQPTLPPAAADGAQAPDAPTTSAAAALTVRFSLWGDSVHGATGHIAYQKWLAEADYAVTPSNGVTLTALDVLKHALDAKKYSYTIAQGDYGAFLTDITTPAGVKLAGGDNGSWGGWAYTVNGVSPDDGMGVHAVVAGDVVCVKYVDGVEWGEQPPAQNPDVSLPNYDAAWPNYQGGGTTTPTNTATSAKEAALAFKTNLKGGSSWAIVSDPLIVNDNIYIAADKTMYIIDATGAITHSAPLMQAIGYTCRLLYSGGKILVPLDGGHIQALAADTLKTVWFSNAVYASENAGADASKHQSDTTLTLAGNSVFFGTYASSVGVYRCLDVMTGKATWTHQNKEGGYYWSGAAYMAQCASIVVAGEDGKLTSLGAADGKVKATFDVGAPVRSTVVALDASTVIVVDTAGVLHKIAVAADGSFTQLGSVKFCPRSTSTPTICNGQAIVGGDLGAEAGYKGILAVIDLATLQVTQRITTPAEVKSAPLVSAQADGTYVYYTANTKPGALYVAKLGTGDGEAVALYTPEGKDASYCIASIIAGADGTLYYTNDAGVLFALKSTREKPVDPVDPVDPVVPGTPDVPGGGTPGVTPGAPGGVGGAAAAPAVATTVPPAALPVSAPVAAAQEKQAAVEAARGEAVPLMASGEARAMAVGSDNGGGVAADQGQRGD